MAQDRPKFLSKEKEIEYWKDKAVTLQNKIDEIETEFDDFRENSSTLEKELEKALEQADKSAKEFRMKCNRVTFDLDASREKITQLSKENLELHKELTEHKESEKKLLNYVRELEQKNDELERCNRVMMATVNDIEVELNNQIEKNALLDTELDEKDALQIMVQRLKDEQRDLQDELQRHHRQRYPDNDRLRSPIDSNKLNSSNSLEPQTMPPSPVKMSVSMGQLSPPPTRITAINLVGDLLRKVGSLESKLAASRVPKENGDASNRESYRSRNQRLNRPSSAVKL